MQVSIEHQDGLERKLKVEIPGERVNSAIEQRLNKLQGSIRLDGFRPGKVPMRIVRNRYGGQVRQEVVGELIQSTLQEAVNEVELQPAGQPQVDAAEEQPDDGGMAYSATFQVYPAIELADMSELAVERHTATVQSEDIDNMIETLRRQRQAYIDVERPAQRGDRVVIDFAGRVDGEAFEGGSGQDTPVDLGSGQMLDGFEEGLEGIQPGESRTLDVTFPEDYNVASLAGKPAQFEVTAKAVQAGQLPAVDEAFIQQFGVESGSLEELREGLQRNMERELKQALRSQVKKQVMDALLAKHPIEVPEALITEEVGRLREQMKQRMGDQGMDANQLPDAIFREEAERRARLGLLLSELVQRNGIQADQEAVRAQVEEMASAYDEPEQVVQYYYQNKQMLEGVEAMVVEDRVVDWVLEQAQVTEVETSFDAVMNANAQAS